MNRYAVIETNSGYVWAVVDAADELAACVAADELAACVAADAQAGGRPVDGHYEDAAPSEINSNRGCYDVRRAPAGFGVDDGQDADAISAVMALPRAGVFVFVPAED